MPENTQFGHCAQLESLQRSAPTLKRISDMKEIPLTRGLVALVDDGDYERVMSMGPWQAQATTTKCGWYAQRAIPHPAKPGKETAQLMHRLILGLEFGDKRKVDHENGDGLCNTKGNLRIATSIQNARNRVAHKGNTSGYKGVCWEKDRGKWHAHITSDGKSRRLGSFEDKERAHFAYCEAAARLHGEFGNTGLPAPYDKPWLAVLMYRMRLTYPHRVALATRAIAILYPQ
jgi:hypothetical protein